MQSQCEWFAAELTVEEEPWAFETGNPQDRISAIGLYADLHLMKYLAAACDNHFILKASTKTDSQGNAWARHWGYSATMPNAAIPMEITLLNHVTHTIATVSHVPRGGNQWADQLTHSDFDGFNSKRRVAVTRDFMMMSKILGVSGEPSRKHRRRSNRDPPDPPVLQG